MAVLIRSSVSTHRNQLLIDAYEELEQEAKDLKAQMERAQTRIEAVRAAMEAMRPLLPVPYQIGHPDADEDSPSDGLDANSPFAGLQFSQALAKFMDGAPPSTPPEIARGFETAGWKFKPTQSHSARVNQVGVTLRRFKGKLFEQEEETGRWSALPSLA